MKEITKYQSNDGIEFSTVEECREHENLCDEIEAVMSVLPTGDTEVVNGCDYIQHNISDFMSVREQILKIAHRYTDNFWIHKSIEKDNVHPGHAKKIIDECCPVPIRNAWYRIYCTDKNLKEYPIP